MKEFGIDVSEFNGTLDYSKLKSAGVKFVIIRAGYGQLESQKDSEFTHNITGAINSGMQIGIYWMSYAWDVSTAIQEANLCAKFCNQYKANIGLPVFFDWEPASYDYCVKYKNVKPNKKLVTDMTLAFINRIEELGYSGGYYTNESFYASFIDPERVKGKNLWIAFYVDRKPEKYDCMIQQYTDHGKLKGVSGQFDLDYKYSDVTEKPAPKPVEKPQEPTSKTESITWGELLSPIATNCGVLLDTLLNLNGKSKFEVAITIKIPKKTVDDIAKEVIYEGKWGSWPFRSRNLKNAGYDPDAVQNRVNELLK